MPTGTSTTRRHRRRRAENTHVKAIHVVIYIRVSTAAQNTLSQQLERCEAYAQERSWTVVDVFAETASAYGPFEQNRPVFRRALARAGRGRAVRHGHSDGRDHAAVEARF